MKSTSLAMLLVLGASLIAVACGDDDASQNNNATHAYCGNGVVEGTESCDGADLGGQTCETVEPGSNGSLACTAQCQLDITDCSVGGCGDGVVEGAEECDCGTDPLDLPTGCSDANGGLHASCTSQCVAVENACCVVVEWDNGNLPDLVFCEGPGFDGGAESDTPTIQITPLGMVIRAGVSRSDSGTNALRWTHMSADGAGSFPGPRVEYWDSDANLYDSGWSTGQSLVNNWDAPGSEITGFFTLIVYEQGGGGAMVTFDAEFCAVRLPDET